MHRDDLRIGVALCGAELVGTVQLGVLFALERLGIQPSHVAGSSSGSLMASLYAHGYRPDDVKALVKRFPGMFLADYGFPLASSLANLVRYRIAKEHIRIPNGVFRGKRLLKYIARLHRNRLPRMPLTVVATDMYSTDPVAFSNDPLLLEHGHAVPSTDLPLEILGSCAMPGLFTPVKHRGWLLVDGGVRDVVPVSILRKAGCQRIIAVNVHELKPDWAPVTTFHVLKRSLDTVLDESMESSDLAGDDVLVIQPRATVPEWWAAKKPMMDNVAYGERVVMEMEEEIRRFLKAV